MTLPDVTLLLYESDWEDAFDAKTLARGIAYASQGRVQELTFTPRDADGFCALDGHVRGSGSRVYRCHVDIDTADAPLLNIDSWCTCPVGGLCKHAAAMCADATAGDVAIARAAMPVRRSPHKPLPSESQSDLKWAAWQRWLKQLDDATPDTTHADPARTFGVLLRGREDGRLLALPAWLRPSRKKNAQGEMADPQALTLDNTHGAVPMPADGWSDADANALVTVLNAPLHSMGAMHWRQIRAQHVENALEQLVRHHRVWFERGATPIEYGEPLATDIHWHEAADGTQHLAIDVDIDPTQCRILKGAGSWYVMPKAHRFGRVEGDARLLGLIERMPELPPELARKVRSTLAASPLAGQLPLPNTHPRGPNIRAKPTPVLHLRTLRVHSRWSGSVHRIGCATPAFDYAGIEVDALETEPVMQRLHAGRLHTLHTDPAVETACIETLIDTGLTSLDNADDFVADTPDQRPSWSFLILPGGGQHPPAPPEAWQHTLDTLRDGGFRLEFSDDFPHSEALEIDDWHGAIEPSGNHWFDVSLGIEVDGKQIDLLPILRRLIADPHFPRRAAEDEPDGATWRVALNAEHYVELPLARVRALIEPLLEWLETEHEGPPRIRATDGDTLQRMPMAWRGGEVLRERIEALRKARRPARTPRGFGTTLRPYQRDGLAWLNFLGRAGLGGILADDMGLGKTVQVLAHILAEKQARRLAHPALVVAPTSLIGNWASETARFAPRLKVLVLHGADRARHFVDPERLTAHDLIITTYPLLPRDGDYLTQVEFSLLILDEAQAIKNPRSQAAQVVRELKAKRRLAMTGTPLENHLGELWAQLDAVEPGLLGSERHFKRFYRTPIEKHGDAERQQRLNRRIGSLMLRRRKEDVLPDLPAKNEIVHTLELAGSQRELYETLRLAQHERVQQAIRQRGMAQSGIIVLDALLKLRQACCDPRLVKLDSARKVKGSAKLSALLELIDGLMAENRHVLVFSQFTSMLDLIAEALDKRKITFETLTGNTPSKQRSARVQRFQDGEVPLFLISLKAGGVGLNLTAADTVIHYDPWWNPAVEAQATDRAHRIGQDKPVFVYRLICQGTVEEKIQAMQARKASLAKAVLEGGSSKKLRFDEADLAELFGPT